MNVVILDTGCANLNSVKSAIGRHREPPGCGAARR
jgi:glutamine amidotransferase